MKTKALIVLALLSTLACNPYKKIVREAEQGKTPHKVNLDRLAKASGHWFPPRIERDTTILSDTTIDQAQAEEIINQLTEYINTLEQRLIDSGSVNIDSLKEIIRKTIKPKIITVTHTNVIREKTIDSVSIRTYKIAYEDAVASFDKQKRISEKLQDRVDNSSKTTRRQLWIIILLSALLGISIFLQIKGVSLPKIKL